ncbi:MAG: aldo/keto reductase [bacterium]|jgi:aryl-alcohol dehydrogenase-like predicted oxidoreductase|nr:aldo/keto reductase [candidate division KSB1 bacterium]MDH7561110.1 aldo/keto reductase [bacterium]
MKYVRLGARGPVVSTIGFGAWAIGGTNWGPTDDQVSKRALHEAIERGVTLIDTADVYGFGHSEELIADVLAERGKGEVVVATKVGNDFYHATAADDQGYGPIRQTYSRDYLVWAAEQSLRRLRLEAIDILQLHSPDLDKLTRDEPWLALEQLKREGKIRYAGFSVQSFKETEQAFLLDEHHDVLDCIQVRYNLLEREAERVLLPKAARYGLGVIVRIPLLFGFLTGKFTRQTRFGPDDHRRMNLSPERLEEYFRRLDRCRFLFERYVEYTPAQVSLAFCLSHPACHVAIPGAKTPEQVAENCAASDLAPLALEGLPPLEAL